MTTWAPDLSNRRAPIYQAIADALAADVDSGALPPGTRLPPQRDLAHVLGLTVTTVTRGYSEAQRAAWSAATSAAAPSYASRSWRRTLCVKTRR